MTNMPRPPLPLQCFNQRIKDLKDGQVPTVKFQRINREKKEVLVGRVKVATPNNGHAFILRRFDTGAISITTLFRAAFPTASEQAERDEISWVAHSYDLTGANGGVDPDRVRFSGRWASPQVASMLADTYGLGGIISALLSAKVEDANAPAQGKITAGRASGVPGTPAAKGAIAPATPASNGPPATKRRKEEPTPAQSQQSQSQTVQATPQRSPAKRGRTPVASTTPAAPPPSQLPRRSTRTRATRSPSVGPPASQVPTTRARSNTPSRTSPRKPNSRKGGITNMGSDETMVGSDAFGAKGPGISAVEEREEDEEAEFATRPNYEEDIAEQQNLISGLKAARERNAAEAAAEAAAMDMNISSGPVSKRGREEEGDVMRFNFKEPEVEERALVQNSRTRGRIERLEPQQKSALWGSLALAVGFGAATLLPNLWSF